MAVPFTSHGYDTTTDNPYTENTWFDAHPSIGAATYGVRGAGSWKVSVVTGADRTVSISAGKGFGRGVTDETFANDTLKLDAISSGSRWDLIVVRRDWTPTGGVSKFAIVKGGTLTAIPSGRLTGPGIDDQPIAFARVQNGSSQVVEVIDMRCWAVNGGVEALDGTALQYLEEPGASVRIGTTEWHCTSQGNGLWAWEARAIEHLSPVNPSAFGNGFLPYLALGWNGVKAQLVEGVVYVNGAAICSQAWTGGTTICNLPAPYRPDFNVQGVNCQINPQGNVIVTDPGKANQAISIAVTFPINLGEV